MGKVLLFLFAICFAAIILIFQGTATDKSNKERRETLQKDYNSIVSNFDFKIDSLNLDLKTNISDRVDFKFEPDSKIIPISKEMSGYQLDTAIYRLLPDSLKSTHYTELSYFVFEEIIEQTIDNFYGNRTRAIRQNMLIKIYSVKKGGVVREFMILGSDPPSTYSYRRSPPSSISGSYPHSKEVFQNILKLFPNT